MTVCEVVIKFVRGIAEDHIRDYDESDINPAGLVIDAFDRLSVGVTRVREDDVLEIVMEEYADTIAATHPDRREHLRRLLRADTFDYLANAVRLKAEDGERWFPVITHKSADLTLVLDSDLTVEEREFIDKCLADERY